MSRPQTKGLRNGCWQLCTCEAGGDRAEGVDRSRVIQNEPDNFAGPAQNVCSLAAVQGKECIVQAPRHMKARVRLAGGGVLSRGFARGWLHGGFGPGTTGLA